MYYCTKNCTVKFLLIVVDMSIEIVDGLYKYK